MVRETSRANAGSRAARAFRQREQNVPRVMREADKKRVTEGMQVGSSYWKVLVLRGLGSWDESEAGGINNWL